MAADTSTGILEVDLIFPRNDTYDPGPFFPIVFAIQNPQLAAPLELLVEYTISSGQNFSKNTGGYHNVNRFNISGADPYYLWFRNTFVSDMEDTWLFRWSTTVTNCSTADGEEANRTSRAMPDINNLVWFTTKKGSQQPDFEAATSDDVCSDTEAFTYNMTGTVKSMEPIGFGLPLCARLSDIPPDPKPCAVKITTASNISAEMADDACTFQRKYYEGGCGPQGAESKGARQVELVATAALLTAIGVYMFGILLRV